MSDPNIDKEAIVKYLRERLPGLLAVYGFGSQIQGTAGPQSDLDLAVLVPGYAEPLLLWELASELAEKVGMPVDLLDLRAASTVMQYQIIMQGERWWAMDDQAARFEVAILSEKTELDSARRGLMDDIEARGTVYGG